jgi:hypothetical protein
MEEPKIKLVVTEDSVSVTFSLDGRTATRSMRRDSSSVMRGEQKGSWYKELGKILKNEDLVSDLGEALEEVEDAGFSASNAIVEFGLNYCRVEDLRETRPVKAT